MHAFVQPSILYKNHWNEILPSYLFGQPCLFQQYGEKKLANIIM